MTETAKQTKASSEPRVISFSVLEIGGSNKNATEKIMTAPVIPIPRIKNEISLFIGSPHLYSQLQVSKTKKLPLKEDCRVSQHLYF